MKVNCKLGRRDTIACISLIFSCAARGLLLKLFRKSAVGRLCIGESATGFGDWGKNHLVLTVPAAAEDIDVGSKAESTVCLAMLVAVLVAFVGVNIFHR